MIIVLLGASGTGKSTIENELSLNHGFDKIVSYTTRKPRKYETSGREYWFVSANEFKEKINKNTFAEYDEYSQGRLYGTAKEDYNSGNKVVVLTPNGLRQLKKNHSVENIFSVLIEANLGTRIKRYVNRCGVSEFNFDDKNEISARVERDFGMFLGVEREVDLVVDNSEGASIKSIANEILKKAKERVD